MRWLGWLALATTALPAVAAETYEATATTTLSVTAPSTVTQTFTASCTAVDPADDAALVAGGKDLRFVAAPDEVLAVSVDEPEQPFLPPDLTSVDGTHVYDNVFGAHVFARFRARCGAGDVVDEAVVDSNDVVTAPGLTAPFAVRRTDALTPVAADAIPVGVEVELVDLGVLARPRGDERVVVSVEAGADDAVLATVELGAADVGVEGRAVVSPRFVAAALGEVRVVARFLGQESGVLALSIVEDGDAGRFEGEGEDAGPGDTGPSSAGCTTAGLPSVFVALGLALRRRRRR